MSTSGDHWATVRASFPPFAVDSRAANIAANRFSNSSRSLKGFHRVLRVGSQRKIAFMISSPSHRTVNVQDNLRLAGSADQLLFRIQPILQGPAFLPASLFIQFIGPPRNAVLGLRTL
jgi:hypothetical protein